MVNLPIVPIPPFFYEDEDENLNYAELIRYLKYLSNGNVKTVMTTAGTSQFHLLSSTKVLYLNDCISISDNFAHQVILGLPPKSMNGIRALIRNTPKCYAILILYPDRLYNKQNIIDYYIICLDRE